MNTNAQPIIDVEPVAAAREATGARPAPETTYRAPSYGRPQRTGAGWGGTAHQPGSSSRPGAAQQPGAAQATIIDDGRAGGRIGGAVQTVGGLAFMAVGVPMLILPGPGVLAIAGGAALAGSGVKKLLRK